MSRADLLDGPLPGNGLLCIEASAGTGKTYALSTLAARWLVESDELRIRELLVVTYTVAAARELRNRIRGRLVDVRDRMGAASQEPDEMLAALAARDDVAEVRRRAARALAEFDTASISTIHAFASTVLGASAGTVGPGDERRRQAVGDVLAAAAFKDTALWDAVDGKDARTSWLNDVVRRRLEHPDLRFAPLDGAAASDAAFEVRQCAERAVELFGERQRRDGALSFADLLTRLDDALGDGRSALLGSLRDRFKVGLIDEFQDTDATQWRVFRRLFLDAPGRTLIVVGDPKQAIYGFRGADIETYLEARSIAEDTAGGPGLGVVELDTNYRSDGALLEALDGLFRGATFDEAARIGFRSVRASPAAQQRRLVDDESRLVPPLSVRIPSGTKFLGLLRRQIAEECAAEAARALSSEVRGDDGASRPVTESDIVVICARRTEFPMLKEAFLRRGIRTTESKSDDVLDSAATQHVEVVLRALGNPEDHRAVAAVAHSIFVRAAGDVDLIAVTRGYLGAWRRTLEERGVLALGRAVAHPEHLRGLLARPRGERLLTDIEHLFELLAETGGERRGPAALLETLEVLRASSHYDPETATRARRVDSDAPAVRFMTAHSSKGLEFGVVLCPFLSQTGLHRDNPTIWRDGGAEPGAGRLIDVAPTEAWTDDRLGAATPAARAALAASAAGGESRRLHYVALTRARHRCVIWWLRSHTAAEQERDELAGLLMDRDGLHEPVQHPRAQRAGVACYALSGQAALDHVAASLAGLRERGLLEVAAVAPAPGFAEAVRTHDPGERAPLASLGVAELSRPLLTRVQRSSFSSLVSGAAHATPSVDATVGDRGADDEASDGAVVEPDDDPFDGLRGTTFGTAVHEALEVGLRRAQGDSFDDVTAAALRDALRRHAIEPSQRAVEGLLRAAAAPIGGGPPLRALARDDVATELRFTLPVAEGVDLASIAATLARLDPEGPFRGWAQRILDDGGAQRLGASLVGSIDLVTSLGTRTRYWVIDHKTNLRDARSGGYAAAGLVAAMDQADYPLQAALYLVALHRYLRWRVVGYDPATHLGGAHYLFLRGMRPDGTEGVMSWDPGHRFVVALSDLLAGVR